MLMLSPSISLDHVNHVLHYKGFNFVSQFVTLFLCKLSDNWIPNVRHLLSAHQLIVCLLASKQYAILIVIKRFIWAHCPVLVMHTALCTVNVSSDYKY